MRKTITSIITVAACALTAYAFWNLDLQHDHEEHHDHHHHDHGHAHAGHDHHDEDHHEHDFVAISQEQLKDRGVELRKAGPGRLQQTISVPGKIVACPDHIAHIFPQVAGAVVEVSKNLGQQVTANETLATLGSKEMAEAKAEYLAKYNKALLADSKYQRELSLHEKRISSSEDFYQSEHAWRESLIDLELARQKLYALGLSGDEINQLKDSSAKNFSSYQIRSPIAGKILSRDLAPGELVSTDHEAFIVADLNTLWVEISVFPQDRSSVREGQLVTLTTHEGKSTKGNIVYLSPIINEETHTSTIIAELDNRTGKWFPGTFVNAELITSSINSPLVIPKESIQNIEGADIVFIPADEGFALRQVSIGKSDAHQCEITEGLSAGETYACKNTFLLKAHLQKDEAEHSH